MGGSTRVGGSSCGRAISLFCSQRLCVGGARDEADGEEHGGGEEEGERGDGAGDERPIGPEEVGGLGELARFVDIEEGEHAVGDGAPEPGAGCDADDGDEGVFDGQGSGDAAARKPERA